MKLIFKYYNVRLRRLVTRPMYSGLNTTVSFYFLSKSAVLSHISLWNAAVGVEDIMRVNRLHYDQ